MVTGKKYCQKLQYIQNYKAVLTHWHTTFYNTWRHL